MRVITENPEQLLTVEAALQPGVDPLGSMAHRGAGEHRRARQPAPLPRRGAVIVHFSRG